MTKDMQALALLVVTGAVVAGLTLWRMGLMPRAEDARVFAPEISIQADAPAASPEPRVDYPLGALPLGSALSAGALARALTELLGGQAAASWLQLEDLPRRFVATVDNLGRPHAPALVWPVNPTPDRFNVDDTRGGSVIALDNAARYTPFVLLAEAVDAGRAVDLYVRAYPLLQQAYEELGFPNRYFNDRLIAVIDLLLATPETGYPVQLRLTEVKGPIASLRPWVRYEFADPALQALSAGQKILLRLGPVNQRRLKDKLTEFRGELASRTPKR